MDEVMIQNWNYVVKPGRTVWIIGDFCCKVKWQRVGYYVDRLNGDKFFLNGNHDKEVLKWLKRNPNHPRFHHVGQWKDIKVGDQEISMCHYAPRSWLHDLRGAWALFGHTHGLLAPYGKSFDVGVDCWDFTPVTFEQIREKMKDLPIGPHPGFSGYVPHSDPEPELDEELDGGY
jgi:calcineurin-like phosphoesterase family protein